MTAFECNQLNDSTVMMLYLEREHILLDPPYQREGEVWSLYKKQLLIDSLINSYDIPKLYFHEYDRARMHKKKLIKYAIVDGKQRLTAIWQFMSGEFKLGQDIEYLRDPGLKLAGLTYEDLRREHPTVHARFTGRSLSVITIRTNDIDLIEDMFSRLNEAVPLNAPEKRNALGGPLPIVIRELVKNEFFAERVSISPSRYRHHDLACKFLYLESSLESLGRPAETKKKALDDFVQEFAKKNFKKKAHELLAAIRPTLRGMCKVFKKRDHLLRSPGAAVVYFLLFRDVASTGSRSKILRKDLERFEEALATNRKAAEKEISTANWELLEYDRLSQTPNDASSIEFRLKVLQRALFNSKKRPKKS